MDFLSWGNSARRASTLVAGMSVIDDLRVLASNDDPPEQRQRLSDEEWRELCLILRTVRRSMAIVGWSESQKRLMDRLIQMERRKVRR